MLEHFADRPPLQLLDLGTGSGAIAIAIAGERPHWSITATDISAGALSVARTNARKHQLNHIEFKTGRWFEPFEDERFDIIISNPPYIAAADPHLLTGDVTHEPHTALVAGTEGLDDIIILTRQAPQHLNKNGWLILEHGYNQKTAVMDCFKAAGFDPVLQNNDLSGQPRLTAGRVALD